MEKAWKIIIDDIEKEWKRMEAEGLNTDIELHPLQSEDYNIEPFCLFVDDDEAENIPEQ